MANDILYKLAARVGKVLKTRKLMLVTAESCTGGGVGEAVTRVPGSSDWFERGFITYTYISKREMLGVKRRTLGKFGAVSEQIAREMAAGALKMSHAQVAMAVTGIAGPTGGTRERSVGTVCFAWTRKNGGMVSATRHFKGNRQAVRRRSVEHALKGVLALLARQKK
ncbi:MAG TPA: CinA family protein [Burkholderiales bacterium]|nr:CinA family protein [Burkholderiales bacterium]